MKPAPDFTKKTIVFSSLLVLSSLSLVIVNIVFSTKLAGQGEKLKSLKSQSEQLKTDIQVLEQQLLTQSSLDTIGSKATALGFTTNPKTLIINADAPVAQNSIR